MQKLATEKSDHLLNVASELFNKNGYHQTGVDEIMRASGISKTTLYKYFRTKEELVLAMLERRSEEILVSLNEALETTSMPSEVRGEGDEITRIGRLLTVLENWVGSSDFHGCNFIRAMTEYEYGNNEVAEFARRHKNRFKKIIGKALVGRTKAQSERLSEQILVVIDGAIVAAHTRQRSDALKNATILIAKALES